MRLDRLLHSAGLASSNREARRQVQGGGVRLNGERVEDPELTVPVEGLDGALLQVGRKKWVRIRVV